MSIQTFWVFSCGQCGILLILLNFFLWGVGAEEHCRTVEASFAALNMMLMSSVASLTIIRLRIQLAHCRASTAFDFMVPFVKVYILSTIYSMFW
jgi:hypothetical protein